MTTKAPRHRPPALEKRDGRTREAALLRKVRADLTAHVGSAPSHTEIMLIERCAQLSLHLAQMDARAAAGGELSEHAAKMYLAWTGSLVRSLRELGLKGAATKPPSLAEILRTPSRIAAE